ncbi:L-isoaspartate O-methyltransferase protein [Rutstroemia sp. NJR-2017a BBW]|nr:L-isoaspartate O-methyltransferase protein [Rutstroemia sp. NJR-2017a BBW]
MAWTCTGSSNAELISNMWREKLICSERVRDAMLAVDRAHYTPPQSSHLAYEDSPQVIGYGATISAPHMHASAAEYLLPYLGPGKRVLDIGSGSGYLTAVLGELCFGSATGSASGVKGKGKVVGLEHIRELQEMGETNMRRSETGRRWLEEGLVRFVVGDGRKGLVEEGTRGQGVGAEENDNGWDAIHVGAAAAEIHQPLIDQLRRPGRIFIPVEAPNGGQHIWVVDKDVEGKITKEKLYGLNL